MAFYTEERLNQNRVLSDADFSAGFTDYLGATIRDAWNDNPTVALTDLGDIYTAQVGEEVVAELMAQQDATDIDVSDFEYTAEPALSMEDQQARIKEAGLEKFVKPQEGYNGAALSLVMDRKREELERQVTRQSASDWYAPAGFVAGLGTSFLDPINLASNFIPGVGQTRALRMLQEGAKQGAKGLALRRAAIGAAEGAVGSVVVEPLVALARSQQQADYGMTDSLLNVAFGTVMGATLHPALGAWGDYKRRQAQKKNPLITAPWETVAPTDKTESLRHQLAQDAYARAQEAGSDMTEEQAYAAAALFDSRARTWAYFENAAPESYYERWAPSFRAEASGDAFIPPDLADGIGQDLDPASRPDVPMQEAPVEAPATAPEPVIQTVPGRWRGSAVSVLTPQGEDRGYYELRELSDIVASHDPDADFARRADYPEGAQERPYHSDQNEKDKVFRNAMTLDPRYLVNDNPDAVNGPPVITESGVVLGGNSRTMSIQLAYGRYSERAELYRQALREKAALFGIDASAVDSMTAPVLVRVVEGVDTPEGMALRSRLYNQSMTQGINRGAEGVSRGRLVSPDSLDILARGMEEGETLRAWLDTGDGKRFIQSLIKDGVLEQTQLGRLLDEKGALTDEGKALVEKTLRGLVVPDADLLRLTPPSVLNKLDAIVPAMLRLKARGEGWDVSKHLVEALEKIAEAQNMDVGLDILFNQGSLLDDQGAKPAVQALAYTLKNASPAEVKLRFSLFAEAAYKAEKGQGMLLASDVTPANSFIRSFLGSVAKVGDSGIAGFNPAARMRDRAILYAWENGGRGHSVETASQRLAEAMRKGEVKEELKDSARAIMGQLAQMEGSVQVFGPKMGERFRYRGGELWQGMYRNKADMRTFIQNTMAGIYGKKTFIGIGELSNETFPGYELQMTDDTVRHVLREEHAGFDDWESVVDVVNAGEAEALDVSTRVTGNKVTVYAKQYGDRVQVALVSPRSEKRRELMLLTTFNTTEKGYAQWMEGIKKDPSQTDAYILTGRGGESPQGLPTGYEEPFSEANIPQTGGDINTLLQRAWHGTPHNFDAFTLQAIGTGEGAQAHGWGLYFAGKRGTGEDYRARLTEEAPVYIVRGEKFQKTDDGWKSLRSGVTLEENAPTSLVLDAKDRRGWDEDALEDLKHDRSLYEEDEDYQNDADWQAFDEAVRIMESGPVERGEAGQLFEVEIPDNDVLLDEQKTFAEQDANVKKLLKKAFSSLEDKEKDRFFKKLLGKSLLESRETVEARNELSSIVAYQKSFLLGMAKSSFEKYYSRSRLEGKGYTPEQIRQFEADPKLGAAEARKLNDEVARQQAKLDSLMEADRVRTAKLLQEAKKDPEPIISKTTGGVLYDAFAFALTGDERSYRVASEFLNEHGIKGITYDGAQDGRCFVVFDDKSIQILDKLYQIIGVEGAARLDRARETTLRTDNLAVAVKMAKEGFDDLRIRLATGWEKGVDGKWRYEIPDGTIDFSGLKGKVQRDRYTPKGAHRSARLKDVLIMPDLYAAYPEIANIRVFTQTLPRQEAAAVQIYSDGTKVIVLNSRYAKPGKPTDVILSNIVHEVQHVIQSAEGFIQGSNPKKAGGFERYEQVAGEAEARNAESRIGYTQEERDTIPLSASSDVPYDRMRNPDGSPIADPRMPVEPMGPLIGREPHHAMPEELPDDYDLGLPPEAPMEEAPRGAVTFSPEDGKAIITFFRNTDASTLPHEMFHIFRRELAETAAGEGSSPQSRDMWGKVCEFVGAKEGEAWTREQEEMFARAGERYLLEGKAPNAQLRGVFERMRQWFMEIYSSMDAAGMEISDTMRQVFGDMFRLSPEESDMAFRYGFGRMWEFDPSEGTDTAIPEMQGGDDPAMQEELNGLAVQRLDESLQGLADMPEVADAVRAQVEQELAVLDAEKAQDKIRGEVLLEAALCDMRS